MERRITVKGVGSLSLSPNHVRLGMNIHGRDPVYSTALDKAKRQAVIECEA